MTNAYLAYDEMVDDALRGVMVQALRQVQSQGLAGDHHFYITFRTDHPRAVLNDDLKSRYPEEITIVLQHQFWDLKVEDTSFSVGLSFNQTPQILVVPFSAVTAFVDPSVKFGLQFRAVADDGENDGGGGGGQEASVAETTEETPPDAASDNIVALDQFRKK